MENDRICEPNGRGKPQGNYDMDLLEIYPLPANPPSAHYDLALAVAVSPKDAIGASWRGGLTLTPEEP